MKGNLNKLLETYNEMLSFSNPEEYYNVKKNKLDQNEAITLQKQIHYLEKLKREKTPILTLTLGEFLDSLSKVAHIPTSEIKTSIQFNNTYNCPPLTNSEYLKQIVQAPSHFPLYINIHYDKSNNHTSYNQIFDITFYSQIDLMDVEDLQRLILSSTPKVFDSKEPTSILCLNNDIENIPLNITLQTFDDVNYTSYSSQNNKTFLKAISNYLNQKKYQKTLMLSLKLASKR